MKPPAVGATFPSMRATLAALLLIAATSVIPASADKYEEQYVREMEAAERWLTKPYSGEITVIRVPWREVVEACEGSGYKAIFGCALVGKKSCDVLIADDLVGPGYEDVLKHERAHCHGWPGHHPID